MDTKRAIVTLIMAAVALPAVAASTVSGTFRSESSTLELVDAYAFLAEADEGEAERAVEVIFTSRPIDRTAVDGALDREDAVRDQMWSDDGSYVAVTVTPDGSFWINAFIQVPGGSRSLSLSGSGTLTLERHDSTRIEGRLVNPEDKEGRDTAFDITFAVDVAGDPVTGTPLPEGGGEAGAAYVAYVAAVQAGDVDAMARHMQKDRAAQMIAARSQPDFQEMLEMLQLFSPTEMTVTGGTVAGEVATLQVQGKDADGNTMRGQVRMQRDGDTWRLAEEDLTTVVE